MRLLNRGRRQEDALSASNAGYTQSDLLNFEGIRSDWRQLISKRYLRQDLTAAFSLSMMSLPLVIAISLASGVDPSIGMTSGIIGGIMCSLLGGSTLGISGPATAMAVLVSATIFRFGLAGLIVATLGCGFLQMLVGVLGLGRLINYVPLPVVGGFTAGIAVILIIGQLPHAFGLPAPDQFHVLSVLSHLREYYTSTNGYDLTVSVFSFCSVLLLPKIFKRAPSVLIAIAVPTILSQFLKLPTTALSQSREPLVTFSDLRTLSGLPLVNDFFNRDSHLSDLVGTMFFMFVLASLESLLSSTASEKLLRAKSRFRKVSLNQELFAQGLANTACALFGGIPVTGVVAQTSANINAGARTRRAGVVHALLLLMLLAFAMPWIRIVPISALAGVLIAICIGTIQPLGFLKMCRSAKVDATVFLITALSIIFVDLLVGVQAGLATAFVIVAVRLSQTQASIYVAENSEICRIFMTGPVTFLSSAQIEHVRAKTLTRPAHFPIVVDFSNVPTLDGSGSKMLIDYFKVLLNRGTPFAIQGLHPACESVFLKSDETGLVAQHVAITEAEVQKIIRGRADDQPIDRLVAGVNEFRLHQHRKLSPLFERLAQGQNPHTLFITCADSRISPNLITSTDPGELFVVRNVGNVVPRNASDNLPAEGAAIEFAIAVLGVKEIVICGHSNCGAMKALLAPANLPDLPNLKKWLLSAETHPKLSAAPSPDAAAKLNAQAQLENLKSYPIVAEKLKTNAIRLHAWFYDIGASELLEFDETLGSFVRLGESTKLQLES